MTGEENDRRSSVSVELVIFPPPRSVDEDRAGSGYGNKGRAQALGGSGRLSQRKHNEKSIFS